MSDMELPDEDDFALGRQIDELEAEIERLREDECKQHNEITKLMRENERLLAMTMQTLSACANCDRLEAENARLRTALQLYYECSCPYCSGDCASANPPVLICPMVEARRALEGKGE